MIKLLSRNPTALRLVNPSAATIHKPGGFPPTPGRAANPGGKVKTMQIAELPQPIKVEIQLFSHLGNETLSRAGFLARRKEGGQERWQLATVRWKNSAWKQPVG